MIESRGLYRQYITYFQDVQYDIVILTLVCHPHALYVYYLRWDVLSAATLCLSVTEKEMCTVLQQYSSLVLTFFIYVLHRMRCVRCWSNTGLSCLSSLCVYYMGWDVWSVKVIMFSHPHLLSAAAAGWPGVVGAVSGQWESAWWLGRLLQRRGERERKEGKRVRERRALKTGIPRRMVSRMLKVDHTSVMCVIKGSLMLCSKVLPYTIWIHTTSHSYSSYPSVIVS